MTTIQFEMIEEARCKYGTIEPLSSKSDLFECFTIEQSVNKLLFWFNIEGMTTKVISRNLN